MNTTAVYLIAEPPALGSNAPYGPIKIGIASNAHARLASLQTGNPRTLTLLGIADRFCDRKDALRLESSLHRRFKGDRMSGEWFRPSPSLLAYIARHIKAPDALESAPPVMLDGLMRCPDCNGEPYTVCTDDFHFVRCSACRREGPARMIYDAAHSAWNSGYVGFPRSTGYRSMRPDLSRNAARFRAALMPRAPQTANHPSA